VFEPLALLVVLELVVVPLREELVVVGFKALPVADAVDDELP